jgi:hypothetical protein
MAHVPCYIAAAGGRLPEKRFPLSRTGWKNARDYTFKARDASGVGMTVLVCPGDNPNRMQQPGIPLYQCHKDSGRGLCFIEGYDGDAVLAGGRKRRRR